MVDDKASSRFTSDLLGDRFNEETSNATSNAASVCTGVPCFYLQSSRFLRAARRTCKGMIADSNCMTLRPVYNQSSASCLARRGSFACIPTNPLCIAGTCWSLPSCIRSKLASGRGKHPANEKSGSTGQAATAKSKPRAFILNLLPSSFSYFLFLCILTLLFFYLLILLEHLPRLTTPGPCGSPAVGTQSIPCHPRQARFIQHRLILRRSSVPSSQ